MPYNSEVMRHFLAPVRVFFMNTSQKEIIKSFRTMLTYLKIHFGENLSFSGKDLKHKKVNYLNYALYSISKPFNDQY